jgi:hypothetical protein
MIRRLTLAASLIALCGIVGAARAAEHDAHGAVGTGPNIDHLDAAKDFADKTLSGVAFIPQTTPQVGIAGTPGLKTVMFQAYLRPDGSALVRAWDPATNRYTPTDTRPWRGEGSTLCLAVPAFALPEPLCIALHSWGPAFGGSGVNYSAMVKGDVRQGSALN